MPRHPRSQRGSRRLHRRAARLRAGGRPQDHEGRARPSEEGRHDRPPPPRRVPRRHRAHRRRHRHRRGVRAGRRDQGRGHVGRQGLRRHDQAAQLQARPRQPRLAQRPRARLDRRLGDAVPRVPGTEDVGPHGRRRASPSSGSSSTRWTSSATCCSSRAPFRARRAASSRSGAPTDGCVEGRCPRRLGRQETPRSRQPCSAPS